MHYRLGSDFEALEANRTAKTWLLFDFQPLLLGRTYSAHVQVNYQQPRFARINSNEPHIVAACHSFPTYAPSAN